MVRAPACHAGSCGFKSRLSRLFLFVFVSLFFVSCDSTSLENFKEEGSSVSKSLTEELSKVHSRNDLITASSKLKSLFNNLVDLIIAAYEFKDSYSENLTHSIEKNNYSELLYEELSRVAQIEGAPELLEKIQEESLNRLDAFEKRRAKGRR